MKTYSNWQSVREGGIQERTDDVLRHFKDNGVMTRTEEENALPEQVNFRCSIHGVQADDVDVEVDGDRVVISGEAGNNKGNHKRDSYFIRTVYLPEGTNPHSGRARVNRDVLEISLDVDNDKESPGRLFLKPEKIG